LKREGTFPLSDARKPFPAGIIAGWEFRQLLRNAWVYGFAAVLAAVGISLALSSGEGGANGFNRLSASLSGLVILLSSLMGILVSSFSFAGDRADRMLELLRSVPVGRAGYLGGKLAGVWLAETAAFTAGFLPAALSTAISGGWTGQLPAAWLSGAFLLAVYTAWGALVGALSKNRLNAVAAALLLWFISLLLFEMALWSGVALVPWYLQKPLVAAGILIDPAETVRVGAVFLQGQGGVFGPEFQAWQDFFRTLPGLAAGAVIALLHLLIPSVLAFAAIRREE
jgi:ABC-type transport system involved in multi-copper enzyme maturation permease subunit